MTANCKFHKFKFVANFFYNMSFGVDTLGGLIEKLKQLVNDTQNHYESFFDSTQLFKQGKMDNAEYFSKMGEYLVSSSALNFLACRIILEMKNTIDKGMVSKSPGGSTLAKNVITPSSGFSEGENRTSSNTTGGFGVNTFVSSGGSLGPSVDYDLPMPQEPHTFRPVDIMIPKQNSLSNKDLKNCIVCNMPIPKHAKFCNKCGHSQ